jgi:hypothetical protein
VILSGFGVLLCCALPFLGMGLLTFGHPEVRGFWWDMLDAVRHRLGLPQRQRYPERMLTLFAVFLMIVSISFAIIALTGQSVTILPPPE